MSEGRLSRPMLFALAGVVVIAIAIGMSWWSKHRDEQVAQPAPTTTSPATTSAPEKKAEAKPEAKAEPQTEAKPDAAAAKAAAAAKVPSFDIVRIGPDGQAVIAGRAGPGANVEILDAGKEIGAVTANGRGEWVYTTDHPLPPGSRELSLRASTADGGSVEGDAPVVLVVPEHVAAKNSSGGNAAAEPGETLAVKVSPGGGVQLLQVPTAKEGAGAISIEVVNYDDKDHLSVAGRATPKATVQVYLDNAAIGGAEADAKGSWNVAVVQALKEGNHTVRADQLSADGKVMARAEISFASGGALPKDGRVTVSNGNSLWRIARRAYGNGFDYITIFKANKEQIRNPDLIYPGQVFKIPSKS